MAFPDSYLHWLADTSWSVALHESQYMYLIIESIHVLTLCLFVGMSVLFDFRLLGVTMTEIPASQVIRRLKPWMTFGFVIMVITGILLFYAIPVRSYHNVFFRVKMLMLCLAGFNAFIFHSRVERQIPEWDLDPVPPRAARRAGAASLVLWTLIVFSGRMIAYNWFDCDKPQPAVVQTLAGCSADYSR
jgi:hypothetical protein